VCRATMRRVQAAGPPTDVSGAHQVSSVSTSNPGRVVRVGLFGLLSKSRRELKSWLQSRAILLAEPIQFRERLFEPSRRHGPDVIESKLAPILEADEAERGGDHG